MVATVMIGASGSSFVGNLSLLLVCVALGVVVHHAAPVLGALRGWRRLGANAGMTALFVLGLLAAAQPQLVMAKTAVFMECLCLWGWEAWCCYF